MNAIELRGVTKSFKKHAVKREYTSFKTEFVRWLTGRRAEEKPQLIEALRGVDLTVPRGATIGIVGRNGSGKSTLLKVVTGIYAPTAGTVQVNGRISALLDLGAGFHPDFTGRENILINSIILGMSREEALRRTPDIIAFSELGDFIDEPVRTYSSGMFMRLAFAVATHVDPEILIIDEILSVGDAHFSRKSRAKLEEFKRAGRTILLVTHELGSLQTWCDSAAWLDGGRVRMVGDPHHVVEAYKQAIALAEAQQDAGGQSALNAPGVALPQLDAQATPEHGPKVGPPQRTGTFRGEIREVRLLDQSGAPAGSLTAESGLSVWLDFVTKEALRDVGFTVSLARADGLQVGAVSTFDVQTALPAVLPAAGTLRLDIPRVGLVGGVYYVDVAMHTRGGLNHDAHAGLYSFSIPTQPDERGVARLPQRWTFQPTGPAGERTGSDG